MTGWFVDAVTLQHFGSVGRISILTDFLSTSEPPYWTRSVHSEILAGFHSHEACKEVLASHALGQPTDVASEDLADVFRLQIALGGGGSSAENHLGEAESIVLADRRHGGVITDDNAAYDLVERRLGPERVLDTIEVLRTCVRVGRMDASDAKLLAEAIRNNGRHLRRTHPSTLLDDYFR